jgi:VIT1/CCC1 family predicted Fe2+/Mn2+ transporter
MRYGFLKGISFGLTSGAITTLGLLVGLATGTSSRLAAIGGVLTIAVADALSDALGMHISEEADKRESKRTIWESTFATLLAKLLVALTFFVPLLLFPLTAAVVVCICWGAVLLTALSYLIGTFRGEKPWHVVGEHLLITVIVVIVSYLLGLFIAAVFGS